MYAQTNTENINKTWSPPTNNWGSRQTVHRLHSEIVADVTTLNKERKDTTYDRTKYWTQLYESKDKLHNKTKHSLQYKVTFFKLIFHS